jgi:HAMP domain-containing protein
VTDQLGLESDHFDRPRWGLSVRWKMLTSFTVAFTLIFAGVWIWVYAFTTENSQHELAKEVELTAAKVAVTLDAAMLADFATGVSAASVEQRRGEFAGGRAHFEDLMVEYKDIVSSVPTAVLSTYYRDPSSNQLTYAATAGLPGEGAFGPDVGLRVVDFVSPATLQLLEQGLSTTVSAPPYTDDYGDWISTFSPVRATDGTVVGGVELDYPLTYVEQIQGQLRSRLIPVMIVSYLALILLVLVLSTSLTRPIERLTTATQRIAEGEYELDVRAIVPNRFPDEILTLAVSVAAMAKKVAARERSLTREVQRLKVEIDEKRRDKSVREITESDFFADLTAKADQMRRKMRDS